MISTTHPHPSGDIEDENNESDLSGLIAIQATDNDTYHHLHFQHSYSLYIVDMNAVDTNSFYYTV